MTHDACGMTPGSRARAGLRLLRPTCPSGRGRVAPHAAPRTSSAAPPSRIPASCRATPAHPWPPACLRLPPRIGTRPLPAGRALPAQRQCRPSPRPNSASPPASLFGDVQVPVAASDRAALRVPPVSRAACLPGRLSPGPSRPLHTLPPPTISSSPRLAPNQPWSLPRPALPCAPPPPLPPPLAPRALAAPPPLPPACPSLPLCPAAPTSSTAPAPAALLAPLPHRAPSSPLPSRT